MIGLGKSKRNILGGAAGVLDGKDVVFLVAQGNGSGGGICHSVGLTVYGYFHICLGHNQGLIGLCHLEVDGFASLAAHGELLAADHDGVTLCACVFIDREGNLRSFAVDCGNHDPHFLTGLYRQQDSACAFGIGGYNGVAQILHRNVADSKLPLF